MTAISILGSLPIVINVVSGCLSQNTISQKPLRVMAVLLSSPKEECLAPWTDRLVPALILHFTLSNLHSPSSSYNGARSNSCKKKKIYIYIYTYIYPLSRFCFSDLTLTIKHYAAHLKGNGSGEPQR